ncbi:Fe-S cluster assembly protein SufD [Dysgonomonadaceae bacterium PH5-43]|nr:Fe-S cluster assembly protein SufD [Dysgonomonadaceae bacterium PH5-43]
MKQYIDFFKTQRAQIETNCSPIINKERDRAAEIFEQHSFPKYKSEDYQYLNLEELLSPDFGFYLDYKGENINPDRVFRCNIPSITSSLRFTVNGHYCEESGVSSLPEGVFAGSFNEFANSYPEIFKKHYNRLAMNNANPVEAFNAMFVQDGFALYVPKGVVIEEPIQITNIVNGKIDSLVNRRILIILEEASQAKVLVCDHSANEDTCYAITQVAEIFVNDNAVLDFYELEESSRKTFRLATTYIEQKESSNVLAHTITLNNGTTRNNYVINLDGERAETNLYGMAIVDGEQMVDNNTLINHNVAHCHSNELFKYLLDDKAKGVFAGQIAVAQLAEKTVSYQNNKNLLGSKSCEMHSKPQLIIYADDVKCSHGMTTGQLDETALFYMRSRGISLDEAQLLLKYAFANEVIEHIRLESLKTRLHLLTEKRFRGELVRCRECI